MFLFRCLRFFKRLAWSLQQPLAILYSVLICDLINCILMLMLDFATNKLLFLSLSPIVFVVVFRCQVGWALFLLRDFVFLLAFFILKLWVFRPRSVLLTFCFIIISAYCMLDSGTEKNYWSLKYCEARVKVRFGISVGVSVRFGVSLGVRVKFGVSVRVRVRLWG